MKAQSALVVVCGSFLMSTATSRGQTPLPAAPQPDTSQASPPASESRQLDPNFPDQMMLRNGSAVDCKVLSETSKQIVARISVGGIEAEVTYDRPQVQAIYRNVRFVSGPAPTPGPAPQGEADAPRTPESASTPAAAAERPMTDRVRLLETLSGPCIGRPQLPLATRVARLRELKNTSDGDVLEATRIALGIDVLYLLLNTDTDFSIDAAHTMMDSVRFALSSSDGPLDLLRDADEMLGSGSGANAIIKHFSRLMARGDDIQRAQNALRDRVRTMLVAENDTPLEDDAIGVRFTMVGPAGAPSPSGPCYLLVTNRTKRPLPQLACVVDVKMSDTKLDAIIAEERKRWEDANRIVEALDQIGDTNLSETQAANMENALWYYEHLRLGYGVMVYTPVLKAGETIKFEFGTTGDIVFAGEGVDVTVTSQGTGHIAQPLDMDAVRREFERVRRAVEQRPRGR